MNQCTISNAQEEVQEEGLCNRLYICTRGLAECLYVHLLWLCMEGKNCTPKDPSLEGVDRWWQALLQNIVRVLKIDKKKILWYKGLYRKSRMLNKPSSENQGHVLVSQGHRRGRERDVINVYQKSSMEKRSQLIGDSLRILQIG